MFTIRGKRYRINTDRLKEIGIVLGLGAELLCLIGWCYWGWF